MSGFFRFSRTRMTSLTIIALITADTQLQTNLPSVFNHSMGKGSCIGNLGAACPYRPEQAATESRQALQYANVQWTHPALPARLPDVVARAQCKRERLPCYFYHARRGRCGKFLNLFSVTRRTVFSLLNNFGLFIPPGRLVALPGHLVTLSGADPGPEPPVNQAFRRFFEKTGQIDAV